MSSSLKRLMKELQQIKSQTNQNDEIKLELKYEDNLYEWRGSLKGFSASWSLSLTSFFLGPINSPYEKAEFFFEIIEADLAPALAAVTVSNAGI